MIHADDVRSTYYKPSLMHRVLRSVLLDRLFPTQRTRQYLHIVYRSIIYPVNSLMHIIIAFHRRILAHFHRTFSAARFNLHSYTSHWHNWWDMSDLLRCEHWFHGRKHITHAASETRMSILILDAVNTDVGRIVQLLMWYFGDNVYVILTGFVSPSVVFISSSTSGAAKGEGRNETFTLKLIICYTWKCPYFVQLPQKLRLQRTSSIDHRPSTIKRWLWSLLGPKLWTLCLIGMFYCLCHWLPLREVWRY